MKHYDFVIAGAGIIGLTIAKELKHRFPQASVLLLEKESFLGMHASGRNSGVLHTGIFYLANTLKARFCKRGSDALFNYAQEHGIAVRKDGKVIVARSELNAQGLSKLMQNAKDSGISAELLNSEELHKIEPHANNRFGGVYCKDTAVIDSKAVLKFIYNELCGCGVDFLFNSEVREIDESKKIAYTASDKVGVGYFINATGSFADRIAKMMGKGRDFQLVPFRGLYYKLKKEQAHRINGSIYPVPDAALPFLGIHFTRNISGDVYVGPTAIPALGRENYSGLAGLSGNDMFSIFSQLAKLFYSNVQNFRNLVYKELPHLTKHGFLQSAAGLVDELRPEWLETSPKVGIRPQLINTKNKCLEMDFVIEKDDFSLHILNSISPAFTSSFAVAGHVVGEIGVSRSER